MKTDDFDYYLPEELIAQTPLKDRSSSRLLVVDRESESLEDKHFTDILDYLKPGDALVLNETKVIPETVKDGTTFKLYYGQTKGDEIELVNPKTGRKSYKIAFFIVLILSLTLIGIMIGSNIRKKMSEA